MILRYSREGDKRIRRMGRVKLSKLFHLEISTLYYGIKYLRSAIIYFARVNDNHEINVAKENIAY